MKTLEHKAYIFLCCLSLFFCVSAYKVSAQEEGGSYSDEKVIMLTAGMTDQQFDNLEKLCLVWGYVKYRHPVFLSGAKDWDAELLQLIGPVSETANDEEANKLLYQWFAGLGSTDYGTEFYELIWQNASEEDKLELSDTSWRDESYLGEELSAALEEIEFIPSVYRGKAPVFFQSYSGVYCPNFSNEKTYENMDYADSRYRLLGLFRVWNAIEYYYPYLDILDDDWKEVLSELLPDMLEGTDKHSYQMTISRLTARLQDAHAVYTYGYWDDEGNMIYAGLTDEIGKYQVPVRLIRSGKQYAVEKVYSECGLVPGDVILECNGETLENMIEDRKQYISVTEDDKLLNKMEGVILRAKEPQIELTILRNEQLMALEVQGTEDWMGTSENPEKSSELLENNIGLINPARIRDGELKHIMEAFADTCGLIVDLRQYPYSSEWINTLAGYIKEEETAYAGYLMASGTAPGIYLNSKTVSSGGSKSDNERYSKPVVILMNERTQSRGEFAVMALRGGKETVTMGSNSVGTDGGAVVIYTPEGHAVQFTAVGIVTPEGGQTQRIGLSPDIDAEPTVEGIRKGRDELIEAAAEYILGAGTVPAADETQDPEAAEKFERDFLPPVEDTYWGMSLEEVMQITGTQENDIVEQNKGTIRLRLDKKEIFGFPADVELTFDHSFELGLEEIKVKFETLKDSERECLLTALHEKYGDHVAVDDSGTPCEWRSESVGDLSEELQTRFRYLSVDYPYRNMDMKSKEHLEATWKSVQKEALVTVHLYGNVLLCNARNMITYKLINDEEAYHRAVSRRF